MSGPLHTVHVRVNDAATGQPTPVRISFVDSQGNYSAPFGRVTDCATGYGQDVGGNLCLPQSELIVRPHETVSSPIAPARFAYIDGSCEIRLPAGSLTVTVHKGPEYVPLRRQIPLTPGKMAIRLEVERWTNWKKHGWYSGDTRAHFLTPHGALLEGAAEDLAVVNLLAFEPVPGAKERGPDPGISNILAFSGQGPALESPGHLVVVNTLNGSALLGHLALLNCHRAVYPLTIGRRLDRSTWELDEWTLADWCDQCHRKGGLVVWLDMLFPNPAAICEGLAELILGKVDAVETTELDWCVRDWDEWYTLLNCGFHVPLVGASGKETNATALGAVRTYAQLSPDEPLTYKGWVEAVRAGRTFATTGPLLTFRVNDQGPGSVVDLAESTPTVRVHAAAHSAEPFERLEVVHNGEAVAGVEASGFPCSAVLEADLPATGGGWFAARCWGDRAVHSTPMRNAAHTSPVYVRIGGQSPKPDPITLAKVTGALDESLAVLEQNCRFRSERARENLRGIFQTARAELIRRSVS